jgi:hypothetical protein
LTTSSFLPTMAAKTSCFSRSGTLKWVERAGDLRSDLVRRILDDRVAEAVDDHRDPVHAAQPVVEALLLHSGHLLGSSEVAWRIDTGPVW